jgi:hypothetical protein
MGARPSDVTTSSTSHQRIILHNTIALPGFEARIAHPGVSGIVEVGVVRQLNE